MAPNRGPLIGGVSQWSLIADATRSSHLQLSAINKGAQLVGRQTRFTSWMAILTNNARRIRRKLFSKHFYPVVGFLTISFILLFYYVRRIPNEVVILHQITVNINDPEINWKRVAHVQYAVSPEDLCKAIMLFSQLKEVSSLASRVLVYPSDWRLTANTNSDAESNEAHIARVLRYAAEEFSVLLNPTDTLREDTSQTLWRQPFSKFLAYNLTQYDRVIVLGTESIVLNSMDELFFLPPTPIAMPYVYRSKPAGWRLSNQIMVVQPSSTSFSAIEKAIKGANSDETDMGIVYKLYNDTLTRLPQRPFHILSEEFRLKDKEHKRYLGTSNEKWNAAEILRQTKLVHFFDPPIPEPWIASDATWRNYIPRCVPTAYRRFNCANRDIWSRFYSDYENRRKNVCGPGFERQ